MLRPRQVRAGIPRPLDALCDQVVNPYAGPGSRHGHDLTTARGIADYLADFVGDPTGMAEAEAASLARGTRTVVRPAVPAGGRTPPPALPLTPPPAADPAPTDPTDTGPTDTGPGDADPQTPTPQTPTGRTTDPGAGAVDPARADSARADSAEQPTQAGLPIFDDETDDVSWLSARPEKPPPPPPFEELPERPLFAPEPTDGQPVRKPRPNAVVTAAPRDFWPWDTGTGTGTGVTPLTTRTRTRTRSPAAAGCGWPPPSALSLVLLLAIVVAFNLGRGRTPLGAKPEGSGPSPSPSASATPAAPITGLTADDFDPQGSPPEEHPELAPLAVDGDPATAWRTMTYTQDFGPGGLKTGVGLVIDLGAVHDVSVVDLTFVGAPTSASLYVTEQAPTAVAGLSPAATVEASGTRERVTLDKPVRGRYLTVWLTSLPQADGGYRGEVAEVAVRG